MSRARRRDFATMCAVAVLLAGVLMLLGALQEPWVVRGAQHDAQCSWSPSVVAVGESSTMTATGLPDRPIAVTFSPRPIGVSILHDGTYSLTRIIGEPTTAYIWTRGGGGALFKPGPQLNDYHPIAVCSVAVQ